jgi:hypothetical protein
MDGRFATQRSPGGSSCDYFFAGRPAGKGRHRLPGRSETRDVRQQFVDQAKAVSAARPAGLAVPAPRVILPPGAYPSVDDVTRVVRSLT